MSKLAKFKALRITFLMIALLLPMSSSANDFTEKAAVGIGTTVGNSIYVPFRGAVFVLGLTVGALSFVLSGGNAEVTQQMWENTIEGPFLITPEMARKAVGERPELLPQD